MSAINLIQKRRQKNKSDTVNIAPIPIILVPGVMGTRLRFPGPLPPPSPATRAADWDPDDPLEMAKWIPIRQRRLAQSLASTQPAVVLSTFSAAALKDVVPDPTLQGIAATFGAGASAQTFYEGRGWAGLAWGFYGPALIDLETAFNGFGLHPVHAFGYDWRQSNLGNGTLLKLQIDAICAQHTATKCIVISHSMGGLVTRASLLAGATPSIQAVIHTVFPAEGAVVAYRRFHTGATLGLDGLTNAGLSQILGVTPLEYAVTQAGLPGPLELMPTNEYPGVFLTAPNDKEANTKNAANSLGDVYSQYVLNVPPGVVPKVGAVDTVPVAAVPVPLLITGPVPIPLPILVPIALAPLVIQASDVTSLTAALLAARTFHSAVLGQVHPNTAILFGDVEPMASGGFQGGHLTDTSFNFPLGAKNLAKGAIQTPRGDGTVPALSARFARAGSTPERQAFSVEHSACFASPEFRAEVRRQVLKFLGVRVGPRVPSVPLAPAPAPPPPTPAPAGGLTPPSPPAPPAPTGPGG